MVRRPLLHVTASVLLCLALWIGSAGPDPAEIPVKWKVPKGPQWNDLEQILPSIKRPSLNPLARPLPYADVTRKQLRLRSIKDRREQLRLRSTISTSERISTSNWWPGFASPGADITFWSAMTEYDSTLIVAGHFDCFDGEQVNRILRWDGSSWGSLGTGVTLEGCCSGINDVVVFNGDLIIGGAFEIAGSDSASNVALWDGTSWNPLGQGLDISVWALAVLNGELYAGTDTCVARWNGTSWVSIGSVSGGVGVETMVAYGDSLVVAGSFSSINGIAVNDVGLWDGATWINIGGSGSDWAVYTLIVHEDNLVAGGWFNSIDAVITPTGVAKWDRTGWTPVGTVGAYIEDLWVHNGELFAGGDSGVPPFSNCVGKWDGSEWVNVGTGLQGDGRVAEALATFRGDLAVFGSFSRAGETALWAVGSWDGTSWDQIGDRVSQGLDDSPWPSTIYQGNLVAGGYFETAGPVVAHHVAMLNNDTWAPIGSGVETAVFALEEHGGNLIAGGEMHAGQALAERILQWDGVSWQPIAPVLDGPVYALASYGNDLIVGGSFTVANGDTVNSVVRWDGTSWSPMGQGIQGTVLALEVYNGEVIAGGNFTSPTFGIARWDGSAWQPLGLGVSSSVVSLEVHGTDLIVGGSFIYADTLLVRRIAQWNGTSWDSLGWGVAGTHWDTTPYVHTLLSHGGNLYAGGSFIKAGGLTVENVASWDGTTWNALESGIDFWGGLGSIVYALAAIDDHLFVGGFFGSASGIPSYYMARWDIPTTIAVPEDPPILGSTLSMAAYPNPFRSRIAFDYDLRDRGHVRLNIYDIQGRLVATLVNSIQEPGTYSAVWDGKSGRGIKVSNGIYFGRIAWESRTSVRKIIKLE